jgi:tetratricopeptide (TPR) repeat protein
MVKGAFSMRTLVLSVLFVLLTNTIAQGQVSFAANAERTTISTGEQGVVVVTLVCNKNLGTIPPPQVPSSEAFIVLNSARQGPSTFSSIEIINGVTKQRNEVHYQFIYSISAKKGGSFVFPSLSITIDGSEYKTNPIPFNATNEVVKNADIKVLLNLSKHSLYIGEQAILTFKVAQNAQSSLDVRNGFSAALEKIDKSFGKSFSLHRLFTNQVTTASERIDGEMYNVFSLQFIVYPLNEGSFNISSVPFEYQELRRAQKRRMDPFNDDFFDSDFFGGGVQAVAKSTFSNQLSITVKALPTSPPGFTGSVGKFIITSTLEPKEIPAGEAATVKITVRGNTRASGIGEVSLPKIDDCETFSPEKQTVTDTTNTGFTTRKTYKFMIIPRQKGIISIPAISLPYFDPESGTYKTASSEPQTLTVTEGKGSVKQPTRYMSQEEILQVGQDIRFIKTGLKIKNQSQSPYKDPIFFILIPLPFIIFLLSLLYKYQSSQRQKNSVYYTRQKALSSAFKQFNLIKKQGDQISQSVFLGKISQIIETYISNKFNFAVTGRPLEELKDELLKFKANEKVVNDLALFIQHLDSYRFGGMAFSETSRSSTLEKASVFLESLEKGVNKEKTSIKRAALTMLVVICGLSTHSFSSTVQTLFDQANKLYSEQTYDSAAAYYQQIINSGVINSSVYFNLGNSYYRLKKAGLARLYYEKAIRLNPGDQDIAANIKYLNATIVDRVPEQERGFIESVLWKLHIFISLKTQLWLVMLFLLSISILLSGALYSRGNTRLWLVYLSVLISLITVVLGISSGIKINDLENVAYGIVLSPSTEAKNQPDGTKILFTAHEGTKFLIRKSEEEWSLVSLPNGVSGWVKNSDLGKI